MEAMSFKSVKDFEKWLKKNHDKSNGFWLKSYKKSFGTNVLKGLDVLGPLLCYGWITGQARKGAEDYTLWWVCPRRKGSLWSEINRAHAERLIKEGKMKPSGMKEINEAKNDGRWNAAYPSQRTASLPKDFLEKINKNKKAKEFLKTLNRSKTYAIIFRLHTTKNPKRREEKIKKIIKMLEKKETFH